MGRGDHPRRRPHPARQPRVARRGPAARPRPGDRRLLRRRLPLGVRGEDPGGARLHRRRQPRRRLHRLEAERLPDRRAARARPAAAQPLLAPPPDPGGRRGGPARSSSTRKILLIGAGGLGSPSSLYLAAAGVGTLGIVDDDTVDETNLQRQIVHSTERLGELEGRVRQAHARGAEPRRHGQDVPGAPHLRERRPDPRRGLGRDRRRRRQLPDALPAERRVGLAQHPGRPRLDLPLRGPGHRLQAARGAVLPLPVPAAAAAGARPELRRGRRARRPAGRDRLDPGDRGAEGRARDRRPARRAPAPLRRAPGVVHRGHAPPRPGLPGLRREPHDHRVHRLRRVLPEGGSHA